MIQPTSIQKLNSRSKYSKEAGHVLVPIEIARMFVLQICMNLDGKNFNFFAATDVARYKAVLRMVWSKVGFT